MGSANRIHPTSDHEVTPIDSHCPDRVAILTEEIDRLRKEMTDTFLQEHSFVSDSVMALSRRLDLKINEYMKQVQLSREEVR
ncbi:Spo0E family sporulation regulatory protein-aspartic acid phosphatase [Cohnella suwonensis]|uniref:Spo0E family sporulation regulatory protein-aspartic acid phosphatase n=1 Tax=Cohnella suwonensis TaxID=696072 RepID=A0ABW0LS48_9BACL